MYFNNIFISFLFTISLFSRCMEQGDFSQQSSPQFHEEELPQYINPAVLQYSENEIPSCVSPYSVESDSTTSSTDTIPYVYNHAQDSFTNKKEDRTITTQRAFPSIKLHNRQRSQRSNNSYITTTANATPSIMLIPSTAPLRHCELCGFETENLLHLIEHLDTTTEHRDDHEKAAMLIRPGTFINIMRIYKDKKGVVCIRGTI